MTDTSLAFKVCTTCSKSHPATIEFFGKSKTGLHGVISTCKPCARAKTAQWRLDNPGRASEAMRKARLDNPEKFRLYEAAQALKHRDKKMAATVEWRKKNPERAKQMCKDWQANNQRVVKEYRKSYRLINLKKIKAALANWYAQNSEKAKAYAANKRTENPEQGRAQARSWYARNKKRALAYRSAWVAANQDKKRVYTQNRQRRKAGSKTKLSVNIVETLFEKQQGNCACCGKKLTKFHLDHRMPLALGGAHVDENMQLLTPLCNMRKGAKHPDDYVKYLQTINR